MENGLRTTGYLTMTRIQRKLQQLKSDGKKAFIAYITLGDPDLESTSQLVLALERAGVDIIELGVPFSDPLADGPVIQRASERALRNGFTLRKGLGLVSELRKRTELPLVLFSYYNPLFSYGFESLARQARTEGVDGFLITDLSVEEAQAPVGILRETGLDTIFLAAPTSTQRRIEAIAHFSSAFIYAVSRTGVTGMQNSVSEEVVPLVARIRAHSDLPVVVGFGISHPGQVREIDLHADGVVVGSAIVRCIEKNLGQARLAEKVAEFTCWLKGGG
jgi:tryptophan synthase alpha chain